MPRPDDVAVRADASADTDPLVLPLDAIRADALGLAGGKAANLGEMLGAGLSVPDGFCLTTRAYELAASAAALDSLVTSLAEAQEAQEVVPGGAGEPVTPRIAGEIRARLSAVTVPAAVVEAVTAAYGELVERAEPRTAGERPAGGDPVRVAVRSSATAEDLPYASFAGQQDTFLDVAGLDAVLDAVRRCWASLWTDRAVSYRASGGIDPRSVRLAVVVQRMVPARVAGVLFTADPLTGRRGRTVIDAAPGLGEAVVSGSVNPDHFVLDTATGQVLTRRTNGSAETAEALPAETTEAGPHPENGCVYPAELVALAGIGQQVEDHYGAPQDIEWAIDADGTLWLTQTRAVTTLYPLPEGVPPPEKDLRVYFSANVAQGVFEPLTPMGVAVFRLIGSALAGVFGRPPADPLAGPPVLAVAGHRLFADITALVRSEIGRRIAPAILGIMETRSGVVVRSLFDDPRLSVIHKSRWPFLRRVALPLLRAGVPVHIAAAIARPVTVRRRLARMEDELRAITELPGDAPAERRLDVIQDALLHRFGRYLPRVMPPIMLPYVGLQRLAGRLLGDQVSEDELHTVLRGLPHNPTTEMDLELWALAQALRGDPETRQLVLQTPAGELARRYQAGELPADAQRRLADFLGSYGHRGVAEIDVGVPGWAEEPAYIFNALANYLRLEGAAAAPDAQFERSRQAGEAKVEELARRAAGRGRLTGALRGRLVRFCLGRVREIGGLRERPKFVIVLLFARLREQLLRVGAELVARDRLAAAEDVFLVDLRAARAGLAGQDLRELVERHRAEREAELRRRHVPRILLSDGSEPEAAAAPPVELAAGAQALSGSPASPGQITAPARVVLNPAGARLEPGEILVAPSTDPGWTPLFLTAGGLVMEMGGAMSHGAVVAREYGIPAVVGVAGATANIDSGRTITVDGSAGSVVIEPRDAAESRDAAERQDAAESRD